jgi:predicted RNA binding protein YcfA (HicA-like mRNA interferase family)
MPKLFSSQAIIKVLQANGFIFVSQKGSHAKFRKTGNPTLTTIVPANRKEIPYGTFRAILRQSQLSEENFFKR